MKTTHNEVGYHLNVKIIEDALARGFGIQDLSHVNTAIAAHVWANIASRIGNGLGEIEWGFSEVAQAVMAVKRRIESIETHLDNRGPQNLKV